MWRLKVKHKGKYFRYKYGFKSQGSAMRRASQLRKQYSSVKFYKDKKIKKQK